VLGNVSFKHYLVQSRQRKPLDIVQLPNIVVNIEGMAARDKENLGIMVCLHLRFPIQIPIRFGVRFDAKGVKQVKF
jgi:hypothetical protein